MSFQGPRSKFLSGGGLNLTKLFFGGGGGGSWDCLLNFSKVRVTIKLLIFFRIFSDVAIGSQNSPH